MKVENNGKNIDYFVAPVVKGYLEVVSGKPPKVTLKGIPDKQKKSLTKKDFEDCVLLLKKPPQVSFLSFRIPEDHGETTVLITKGNFVLFQPNICVFPPNHPVYGFNGKYYWCLALVNPNIPDGTKILLERQDRMKK